VERGFKLGVDDVMKQSGVATSQQLEMEYKYHQQRPSGGVVEDAKWILMIGMIVRNNGEWLQW